MLLVDRFLEETKSISAEKESILRIDERQKLAINIQALLTILYIFHELFQFLMTCIVLEFVLLHLSSSSLCGHDSRLGPVIVAAQVFSCCLSITD